jgi:hypothetical protein
MTKAKTPENQPPPEDLEYADGHTPATYSDADVEAHRASAGTDSVVDAGDNPAPPPDPNVLPTPAPEPVHDEVEEPPARAALDAPEHTAYCHNSSCVVNSAEVWHPVDDSPVTDGNDPCQCEDLDHPHRIRCQCLEFMKAEPISA